MLSASAAAAASPAEPNKLALQLLMPRAGLLATPLYTKRLCHVPLAEALLKPGGMAAGQVCPSDALALAYFVGDGTEGCRLLHPGNAQAIVMLTHASIRSQALRLRGRDCADSWCLQALLEWKALTA